MRPSTDLDDFLNRIEVHDPLMGLDLSKKRMGFATGRLAFDLATPKSVVIRRGEAQDREVLRKLIADEQIKALIIGLPILPSGEPSKQTQSISDMALSLCAPLGLPIWFQDESYSSLEADDPDQQFKDEAARTRRPSRKRTKPPEALNDARAAAVLLADFFRIARARRSNTTSG